MPIAVRVVRPRYLVTSPYRILIYFYFYWSWSSCSGSCPFSLQGLLDTVRFALGLTFKMGLWLITMARLAQAAVFTVLILVTVVIASRWKVPC